MTAPLMRSSAMTGTAKPEAASFESRIADDPIRLISAATVLEVARWSSRPVSASLAQRAGPVVAQGRRRDRRCLARMAPLQRPASSRAELRRLLLLCTRVP
jgi:uncharacterized protein with PIN domain